jgi:hypothetical protein
MVKRYSFLLLKAEIHANPSSNILQCTDTTLYSLKLLQSCRVLEYRFVTNGLRPLEEQVNYFILDNREEP